MKFESAIRRAALAVAAFTIAAFTVAGVSGAHAADKKDKPKPPPNQTIDSGSFGIFINGRRVATETFHIEQQNGNSVIRSQLKATDSPDSPTQKSELQLTSSAELLNYEWSQSSGGSLTVYPDNDFLKEKITTSATAKAAEQAFLLPRTSPILDNNFFVHREVLAWRFLNGICQESGGDMKCKKEPADFGTLIPQDRTSMSVHMELIGNEKVTIHGVERELMHLNLSGEGYQWALWVDNHDHFKLMRVSIPADNTLVDRD